MSYWKGWFRNTGEYSKDLMWAYNVGKSVIDKYKTRPGQKKKCVVFDVDDTLLFGDPEEAVGYKDMELGEIDGQEVFFMPRNEPICRLAEYAKAAGFIIVVVTARMMLSKLATIENLKYLRIPFDILVMNEASADPVFKVSVRRKLAENYDICLTVGDKITDVICPGANTAFIKVPEPSSKVSYAYLPPGL